MLLNGDPKRFYSYKNPVVLPFKTFDGSKENFMTIIKKMMKNIKTGLDVIGPLFKKILL